MDLSKGLGAAAEGAVLFAADYASRVFVGRERELEQLDSWLASEAKLLLVSAPAGRGKSALLHAWASRRAEPTPVWVPISQRFGTPRSATVRQLLGARLGALGYADGSWWVERVRAYEGRTLVVLDGLDELVDGGLEQDLRELIESETDVKLVVAARDTLDRDASAWLARLGRVDGDRGSVILELGPLERRAIEQLLPEGASDEQRARVARLADGDPLTAQLLAEAHIEGRLQDGAGQQEVPGLAVAIASWWPTSGAALANVDAVAKALARAVGPVPHDLLAAATGLSLGDVQAAAHTLRRLLVRDGAQRIAFSHPRLADYCSERMTADERHEADRVWVVTLDGAARAVREGHLQGQSAATVVERYRVHLERAGAPLGEFAKLVDVRWLDAWEALEGATTGFLADLLAVLERADAALEREWSPAACTLQMKCSALATFLTQSEAKLSAPARAAALRLGLRSRATSVLSLSALVNDWEHRSAARELLPELDVQGFDLLLDAAGPPAPRRWPVPQIVARLLEQGRFSEALRWSRQLGGHLAQLAEVAKLFEVACAPAPMSEALKEIARTALMQPDEADDVEGQIEDHVDAASLFESAERDATLRKALALLDAAGDDALFWDSSAGDQDPRLVLARALAAAGLSDEAQALGRRVRRNRFPFADRCSETPATPPPGAAIGEDAATSDEAAAGDEAADDQRHPEPDEVLSRHDLEALLVLMEVFLREPAGRCSDAVSLALQPLGSNAAQLSEEQLQRGVDLLWRLAQDLPKNVTWWQVLAALMALLPRCGDHGRACVQAVYERAMSDVTQTPELCLFSAWTELFSLEQQREYVAALLRRRVIGKPGEVARALLKLSAGEDGAWGERAIEDDQRNETVGERRLVARVALEAAKLDEGWRELPAVAARFPELWESVRDRFLGSCAPVSLHLISELAKGAPSPEQGAALVRYLFESDFDATTRFVCVHEFLSLLPVEEAKSIVDRMALQGATFQGSSWSRLPSAVREHALGYRLAHARKVGISERVAVLVDNKELTAHPDLPGELEYAVGWVRQRLLRACEAPNGDAIDPNWQELTRVLRPLLSCLPATLLDEFEPTVRATADTELVQAYNHRRQTLGQFERQIEGLVPMDELDVFIGELGQVTEPLQLEALLSGYSSTDILTYAWLHARVCELGLAGTLADYATKCDARVFLRALVGVWGALTPEHHCRLEPALFDAMERDRIAGTGARFAVIPLLSSEAQRRQWRAEMSHQRQQQRFSLVTDYSAPLGLAREHARVVAEVASWFVRGA